MPNTNILTQCSALNAALDAIMLAERTYLPEYALHVSNQWYYDNAKHRWPNVQAAKVVDALGNKYMLTLTPCD